MAEIHLMPASFHFTPEQALESAKAADLEEVLVIGHDKEGNFFVRSSRMGCRDAFFLAEKLRHYALTGGQSIDG